MWPHSKTGSPNTFCLGMFAWVTSVNFNSCIVSKGTLIQLSLAHSSQRSNAARVRNMTRFAADKLGTGHYLWPGGGGGSEDFGGNHLIFRRTEGGISRN